MRDTFSRVVGAVRGSGKGKKTLDSIETPDERTIVFKLKKPVGDWRGPFWALAALPGLAALFIGRFIPPIEQGAQTSVRPEVRALRQGRLWLALTAAMLIMGGVMATYTSITPLLTDRAGIPAGAVPLVLIAFGIGALGGTAVGGRLGDHRPMATTITAAAATAQRGSSPGAPPRPTRQDDEPAQAPSQR